MSMRDYEQMTALLTHIESIVWDPNVTEASKVASIQGLLYQWGACQDAKTEQMFGDDDTYPYPNTRRC